MTDLEILERAKTYIDKMANGINPLTDDTINENDFINNVKIARCLFYVSDILRQVIDNGGKISSPSKKKMVPFYISPDELSQYKGFSNSITLSEIAKFINGLTNNKDMKKLGYKDLAECLVSAGYLENYIIKDRTIKRVTQKGYEIGISYETRTGAMGNEYQVIVYNTQAQAKVVELLKQKMLSI